MAVPVEIESPVKSTLPPIVPFEFSGSFVINTAVPSESGFTVGLEDV